MSGLDSLKSQAERINLGGSQSRRAKKKPPGGRQLTDLPEGPKIGLPVSDPCPGRRGGTQFPARKSTASPGCPGCLHGLGESLRAQRLVTEQGVTGIECSDSKGAVRN